MYRFVDLNESYWTNPDGTEDAQCAILDTRTNRFLECDGTHVLGDIDEVRDAAGERGVELVPFGFFERKQAGTDQFVECDTCRAKPGSPVLCDDCLRRRREWCARVMITPFRNAKETDR